MVLVPLPWRCLLCRVCSRCWFPRAGAPTTDQRERERRADAEEELRAAEQPDQASSEPTNNDERVPRASRLHPPITFHRESECRRVHSAAPGRFDLRSRLQSERHTQTDRQAAFLAHMQRCWARILHSASNLPFLKVRERVPLRCTVSRLAGDEANTGAISPALLSDHLRRRSLHHSRPRHVFLRQPSLQLPRALSHLVRSFEGGSPAGPDHTD